MGQSEVTIASTGISAIAKNDFVYTAAKDINVASAGTDDSCLAHVNSYRAGKGIPALALNSGKMSCAAAEAAKDGPNLNWHSSFGDCGEMGQCEAAGQSTCEAAIDSYYSEGPGGGHYDIIMDGKYTSMAYGKCDCSTYNVFWTHSFFTSGSSKADTVSAAQSEATIASTVISAIANNDFAYKAANVIYVASGGADDSCLAHVNSYRAGKGIPALALNSGKMSCAAAEAAKDGPNLNWHSSFGDCGEMGQCEAAGQSTCEAAIDSYYSEGPGGGHYDIIMDGKYTSMAYGKCDCSTYNVFWTH